MSTAEETGTRSHRSDEAVRFGSTARTLHWAMAVSLVAMLILGAMLVGSLGNYHTTLILHQTVGVVVLVLAVVRVGSRMRAAPPPQLPSIGRPERVVAGVSEALMYVLLFVAQPLVGWALASASGIPIRLLGGVLLPALAPTSAPLYHLLREVHTVLAYALLLVFAAHMCAVLAHTLLLRDRLLRRMTFSFRRGGSS